MDVINLISSFIKPKPMSTALKYYIGGAFVVGTISLTKNLKEFIKHDPELIPFAIYLWIASPIVAPYEVLSYVKDKVSPLKKFWNHSYYKKQ